MTLDEAIKHCLEVADKNEISAITFKNCKEIKTNMYEKLTAEKSESDCRECAADHRQLAEWLTELKDLREENKVLISECDRLIKEKGELLKKSEQITEYKRLLKAAVDDVRYCMRSYDPCEVCDLLEENGECTAADDNDCSEKYKWRCESEVLALIGEDGDTA